MTEVVKFPEHSRVTRKACEWIAKLDGDGLTGADRDSLRAWIAGSEVRRTEIVRLARLWDRLDALAPLLESGSRETGPELEAPEGNAHDRRRERVPEWRWFPHAVSMSVLLLGGAAALLIWYLQESRAVRQLNGLYETSVGEQRTIELTDGSTILLNTNSRVEVAYERDARALRLLDGEAYFDVASERTRPFTVRARDNVVEAMGTEFSVKIRETDVEVLVNEGRVRLTHELAAGSRRESADDMLVQAGNVARIGSQPGTAREVRYAKVADIDQALSWRRGALVFDNDPLWRVVEEIGRYTSYKIVIADPEIYSLPVGGHFQASQTKGILDSLEQGFDLRVEEIREGVFYISDRTE